MIESLQLFSALYKKNVSILNHKNMITRALKFERGLVDLPTTTVRTTHPDEAPATGTIVLLTTTIRVRCYRTITTTTSTTQLELFTIATERRAGLERRA
jgi:hypothetical protein